MLSKPLVIIGLARRNPHFLLHTDPHQPRDLYRHGEGGRRGGREEGGETGSQRQINVCKHAKNCHFSWRLLERKVNKNNHNNNRVLLVFTAEINCFDKPDNK